MSTEYFKTADHYINNLFPPDDIFSIIEQSVTEAGLHDMSVSPNQGRFLYVMARQCNAKRILELGTFVGYSTVWLAKALPPDGTIHTIEFDETYARIARKNFAQSELDALIEVRVGKALDILPEFEDEGLAPFDMIFIDADKPSYPEYFKWALRLSMPGTLIIVDNVIRHKFDKNTPEEKRTGVEQFNELVAATPSVTATIIQNVGVKENDGMAIVVVN